MVSYKKMLLLGIGIGIGICIFVCSFQLLLFSENKWVLEIADKNAPFYLKECGTLRDRQIKIEEKD